MISSTQRPLPNTAYFLGFTSHHLRLESFCAALSHWLPCAFPPACFCNGCSQCMYNLPVHTSGNSLTSFMLLFRCHLHKAHTQHLKSPHSAINVSLIIFPQCGPALTYSVIHRLYSTYCLHCLYLTSSIQMEAPQE